mmetsp:Transcript_56891/g.130657  ORF Transcript_56891/g.130657 Transcript_56891/m.130657 type:complete len:162 (-) Transcript_56891:131-616(-)
MHDGWALQFGQHALCLNTAKSNVTIDGRNSSSHPYDLHNCRDRLLRPRQELHLTRLLSYSLAPSIWTWSAHGQDRPGALHWLIVPRPRHRDPAYPKREIWREARITNSLRVRTNISYNKSTKAFSGSLERVDEQVLLPGQCLRVLSLTQDGTHHTCIAEQC